MQLLACIGEQFTEGDEICGVVVNMRAKQDKICLWTKSAANEAAQVNVGKQFKSFLEYDQKIGFLSHVRRHARCTLGSWTRAGLRATAAARLLRF